MEKRRQKLTFLNAPARQVGTKRNQHHANHPQKPASTSSPTAPRKGVGVSAAGLKPFLRQIQTWISWDAPLIFSAVPVVGLLFFAPAPPALAEFCYRSSNNKIYYHDIFNNKVYSRKECTILDLSSKKLENLPAELFKELNNLKYLYLNNNNLSSLPEEIFNGLHNLQRLTLHENNLNDLPEEVFSELHNLQVLALDNNNLSDDLWRQQPNIFNRLRSLRALWLWGNNLTCLPNLPASLENLYLTDDNTNSINDHNFIKCRGNSTELGP